MTDDVPTAIGTRLGEVDTPALLIDIDAFGAICSACMVPPNIAGNTRTAGPPSTQRAIYVGIRDDRVVTLWPISTRGPGFRYFPRQKGTALNLRQPAKILVI